ncbi:hypothetical protein ACFYXL_03730 [Streptomyces tsukubensis]|uniref:hypothetical protein n=1 Tax=Streptomyces tsukubensis TaxID=83656 RepID=UPI0036B4BDD8
MVSVQELDTAQPQKWRDAAADVIRAAQQCEALGAFARDEIGQTLKKCWSGDAARGARDAFHQNAGDYEAAAVALRALAKTYDGLAETITTTQRDLRSGVDYARRNGLVVDESGRVRVDPGSAKDPADDKKDEVTHAAEVISAALATAGLADRNAARDMRTFEGMTKLGDANMAREALNPNSPLAIALRLSGGLDGVHPLNVPPTVLASVDRAARETGMSRKLLLAILWQEQQWYQNFNPSGRGLFSEFGRFANWAAIASGQVQDKSLGIVHIKPDSARKVAADNAGKFMLTDGRDVKDLSNQELAVLIENDPELSVRLAAHHLAALRENQHGSATDKHLFLLYAADTPQMRESNERYGDESDQRGGAIKPRANNWDRIEPQLDDAMAWNALTPEQRAQAFDQVKSQAPAGTDVSVDSVIRPDSADGKGTGEREPVVYEPGLMPPPPTRDQMYDNPCPPTPEPSPGPSPTPRPGG